MVFQFLYLLDRTLVQVKVDIEECEKRFKQLKEDAIKLLEDHEVGVTQVVYQLTDLSVDERSEHKAFLSKRLNTLGESRNHWILFGFLNFHWSFLAPYLLEHLIKIFPCLRDLRLKMNMYKGALRMFRVLTPLKLFCKARKWEENAIPNNFSSTAVAEFKKSVSDNMTLETIEEFRKEYCRHYYLHDFAMWLANVKPGCFIVSWFLSRSIVMKLKRNIPENLFKDYDVTKIEIDGECVYIDGLHATHKTNTFSTTVESVSILVDPLSEQMAATNSQLHSTLSVEDTETGSSSISHFSKLKQGFGKGMFCTTFLHL